NARGTLNHEATARPPSCFSRPIKASPTPTVRGQCLEFLCGSHNVFRQASLLISTEGSSLACGLPTNTRRETCHIAPLGQSSYENSPPKTRSSFAPDYRPLRFLRLRARAPQRLATPPPSR